MAPLVIRTFRFDWWNMAQIKEENLFVGVMQGGKLLGVVCGEVSFLSDPPLYEPYVSIKVDGIGKAIKASLAKGHVYPFDCIEIPEVGAPKALIPKRYLALGWGCTGVKYGFFDTETKMVRTLVNNLALGRNPRWLMQEMDACDWKHDEWKVGDASPLRAEGRCVPSQWNDVRFACAAHSVLDWFRIEERHKAVLKDILAVVAVDAGHWTFICSSDSSYLAQPVGYLFVFSEEVSGEVFEEYEDIYCQGGFEVDYMSVSSFWRGRVLDTKVDSDAIRCVRVLS